MNLKLTISKVLQNNPFSPEEFARDDGISVFLAIQRQCEKEISQTMLSAEKDYLFDILKQKYESDILRRARWTRDLSYVKEGEIINCEIGSQQISARVHVSPQKVSAEIISPYSDTTWCSLAEFSPYSYTLRPYIGSPANEEGIKRLKVMIVKSFYRHSIQA